MAIRDERAAVFMFDMVNFTQGIYKRKVEVPPEDIPVTGITKAYRIQYYPLVPARRAVSEYTYNMLPSFVTDKLLLRETETIYPEKAIDGPKTLPQFSRETPEWVIILEEDIHGNSAFADHVEMDVEESITAEQQSRQRAEQDSALKELQSITGETPGEREGKSPKDSAGYDR